MIQRNPFWIELNRDEKVFVWAHSHIDKPVDKAVLIVGPIGPEYMHCYRSVRTLADKLADAGYLAIRYDHPGMGNSTATLLQPDIWPLLSSAPIKLKNHIKSVYGISNICVISLRAGALVLDDYLKTCHDDAIMFWYPIVTGAEFVRNMEMLDSYLSVTDSSHDDVLEGGGYPLSLQLQGTLAKVDLLQHDYKSINEALVIESKSLDGVSELSGHLSDCGVDVTTRFMKGQRKMCRQAALSVVPLENIETIADWLGTPTTNSSQKYSSARSELSGLVSENYNETAIMIQSDRPVFGVLTTPLTKSNALLILANSGSGHHAGPNRFHVDSARLLAQQGIATFRMDLSNLGDSPEQFNAQDNHPYPDTADQDIINVLDYFKKQNSFEKIIVGGLCSGAHNVFHAALQYHDEVLKGLVLINMLTFYWTPGQSVTNPLTNELEIDSTDYQSNLFNIKKWLGLFSSPSKIPRLGLFVIRFMLKKIKYILVKVASLFGFASLSKLDMDLSALAANRVQIFYLFSKNEPALNILLSSASVSAPRLIKKGNIVTRTIHNADHTFTLRSAREELITKIADSVKSILDKTR